METINEVMTNDERIHTLALYYESEGMTKMITDPGLLHRRFAEFKRRILNKGITFRQLEQMVFKKYGVTNER